MSNLKKVVNDKVKEIQQLIPDATQSNQVIACVSEIIGAFSEQLLEVSRRQVKLEEKTEEIFTMLSNIEEELVQNMMDDFVGECPYCGEDISYAIPEDGSDFECPKCHNIIELEMMFDDGCDCDCGECHGGCHDDCDDEDDEK